MPERRCTDRFSVEQVRAETRGYAYIGATPNGKHEPMRIAFIEIGNFRKLRAVRVELTESTTLLVGANNSGKTSAMIALRRFLKQRGSFSIHDFTLSHWTRINALGSKWEADSQTENGTAPSLSDWSNLLPELDVWLDVGMDEIHYVSDLVPTLGWQGGLLGVRLRFEPKKTEELYRDFIASVGAVKATQAASTIPGEPELKVKLWPQTMIEFLDRRLSRHFVVRGYILDPTKCLAPQTGVAKPQALPDQAQPIDGDPFKNLIRIDEIHAQRGFGDSAARSEDQDAESEKSPSQRDSRRLSEQLRGYYAKHLDPLDRPEASDLIALHAIEAAQTAFDDRLRAGFGAALNEVEQLGYPGVTDPKLTIATRIRPTDGLNHDAAVQYRIAALGEPGNQSLLLPEDYNGLGYQNLISIIFRLMSFRDAWMRVGKAGKSGGTVSEPETVLPPLHLVLVEEPEAHLHAQVQQVFIRKAYDVLRRHPDLGKSERLLTQLVVSTHSSHVAHETHFECLRYFRRLPAGIAGDVPTSAVINLSEVFGKKDETQRFVTRYLRSTHCDLFFADAAILVEGPAERMLVPHFVRRDFKVLDQCYITWLEIGGSHAHRLEPLIKHLGLLTLVITDLDSAVAVPGKAVPPARGKGQLTANATLRAWVPKKTTVDELLDLNSADKISPIDTLCSVRVAYQSPVKVTIGDKDDQEALPSTFEDALVFDNLSLFAKLEGNGLIKKFRDAIAAHRDPVSLGEALFESLRTAKKAEFALELLEIKDTDTLQPPAYIKEGLTWLEGQLKKKEAEIDGNPTSVKAA